MPPPLVHHISTCTITPQRTLQETPTPKRHKLTPWDLAMLTVNYIQKGLLFYTPSQKHPSNPIVHLLKQSLSQALAHFPLAGHLKTHCADFIHVAADVTVLDILDPIYVPQIVKSFFVFDVADNYDGHSIPLLGVQVTEIIELVDGIFIGCSFNHAIGDGTSFTHFLNMWSEITRKGGEGNDCISAPPIRQQCFCDLDPSLVRLPFSEADEFIERFLPPPLRERIFHFTAESISRLKVQENKECNSNNISSFQVGMTNSMVYYTL
ncbi:hypothetical protein AAC387_Pa04g1018 [Persea americana]